MSKGLLCCLFSLGIVLEGSGFKSESFGSNWLKVEKLETGMCAECTTSASSALSFDLGNIACAQNALYVRLTHWGSKNRGGEQSSGARNALIVRLTHPDSQKLSFF